MSIIWADFPSGQGGLYGTTIANMLNGIWAETSSNCALVNDPDPNITGNVLRVLTATAGSQGCRFVLPAGATATVGVGQRVWLDGLPWIDAARPYWNFNNGSNAINVQIRISSTGTIQAYRGNQVALLGESLPAVTANAYSHVEMKILFDATVGTVEVRVNGIVVLDLTGLNTVGASGTCNQIEIKRDVFGAGFGLYIKDIVFWDTAGTVGNDFQGSVAVRDLYPDADISLNWTPSTGSTGWDLIDETTPDDADYIEAGDPPPAAYKASLTDLPVDVTSVRALLPICRSVKTDGGDCSLQIGLTPNDTDWDDGADNPLTTAFTYRWDVSELSPATAAAWTPTEVNAAYVRANRTL